MIDTSTYLMARARVLSPEPDSPFLWFGCRRRMESWAMTLSSATLSWVWVVFRPLSSAIPKILMLDSSFGIPLIVKLDLLRFLLNS